MTWLKQSTAADVEIGPIVDDTDFKSAETAQTLAQADCQLIKNGGAAAQKNDATSATHLYGGHYKVPLNTTDTGTLGRLRLMINKSGCLPAYRDFEVVPANVWDSYFSTDKLQVHADEITSGLITAAAIATGAIDADSIADGAIDAGAIADGSLTAIKFADDFLTAAKIANGAIDAATFATGAITAAAIAADAIGASELAADAVTEIQSGLATAAELAKVPKSDGTASWNATALAAINAEVDTALNTAIPGSPVADSVNERVATMDGRILGTLAAGTHNAQGGDAYARLGAPAGASVSADVAAVKVDTAAILADTGTDGVVVAAAAKTGYKLASDGLDTISTTAPAGVASNFREMMVQLWRRHFKKVTMTSTQLKTYADNGSTVVTTQTVSDDGTVQTQGAAS